MGSGQVEIQDLGWYGIDDLSRATVRSRIQLTANALELPDIQGTVLGGDLRARVRYMLTNADRSYINLTLDRAIGRQIFGLLGIDSKDSIVSLSVRGRIGREYRGTGEITIARGAIRGIEVSGARLPLEWTFTTFGGRIAAREVATTIAGGRLTGNLLYSWGADSVLDGKLKFTNVCIRNLVGNAGGVTPGRATGILTLSGKNVQRLEDVQGLVTARLGGEESLFDLPLLKSIAPLLSPTRLLAPTTDGDLRARLAGGILRVERFTLTGRLIGLFASGSIGLTTNRLDLDIVARTGVIGPDLGPAGQFIRIAAFGALPVGVILEASRFLSNRTVRLKLSGSIQNPTVTVNAGQILVEEVIRYFLGGAITGGGAAGLSTN